jgi:hypothetical protein
VRAACASLKQLDNNLPNQAIRDNGTQQIRNTSGANRARKLLSAN